MKTGHHQLVNHAMFPVVDKWNKSSHVRMNVDNSVEVERIGLGHSLRNDMQRRLSHHHESEVLTPEAFTPSWIWRNASECFIQPWSCNNILTLYKLSHTFSNSIHKKAWLHRGYPCKITDTCSPALIVPMQIKMLWSYQVVVIKKKIQAVPVFVPGLSSTDKSSISVINPSGSYWSL